MTDLVLATQNPGKVDELRAILADAGLGDRFSILGLADLDGGLFDEPIEGRDSFLENATIKATTYARLTGRRCLADDSGLVVDALDNAPGVISSHYATDGVETGATRSDRDRANNTRLLAELEGVPDDQRSARFVCVMVLACPDATVLGRTEGAFEGRIGQPGDVPRGSGGFGYDPLFLVAPDFARTSAEMPPAEKNIHSHRGEAARHMVELLADLNGQMTGAAAGRSTAR